MTHGLLVLSLLLSATSPAAATPPRKKTAPPAVVSTPATADKRELRRRPLTVDDGNVDKLPEIHVAKGTATVVTFQSDIAEGGVLLGTAGDLFYPLAQTARMAVLSPKNDLAGTVPVNVQLKDGTILTFQLMSSKSDVDVQVDVFLNLTQRAAPDSPVTLRATIGSLRQQLDECRATAGDAGAQKLASLLTTQNLDAPQVFDRRSLRAIEKQNRVLVEARAAYRLFGLTYVVLLVENRDPSRSWVLDRAEVSLAGGREKSDIKVAASAAEYASLAPDQAGKIVVAFPTPANGASQRVVVSLFERDGGRVVHLPALEL